MVIRIRFGKGPGIRKKRRSGRRAALAMAALLTPGAVMALVLACWRIAADLSWTSSFAISSGLFSHWQVWIAAAALLQLCSHLLNRYGRDGGAPAS
jgi:hypothetical protein